jgi:excisionase family DNA binding protein
MATVHPAGTDCGSCDRDRRIEPLAVSPRQACLLLGIGNTRLYELIRDRELVTYNEGRARRITMESIHARVARLIAAGDAARVGRQRPQSLKQPGVHSAEALLAPPSSDSQEGRRS